MKVYVEREKVIEFLAKVGAVELIPHIEALPTIAVTEDGEFTVEIEISRNTKTIENTGTMNFNFD